MLLILAGVSIAMLTGENGILIQSNKASKETKRSEVIERAKLDIIDWKTSQLKDGKNATITIAKVQEILTGKEYVKGQPGKLSFLGKSGDEIYYVELDSSLEAVVGQKVTGGNKIYITNEGVAVIPSEFTIVPGCEKISEGLVISDDPNDTEEDPDNIVAKGNQFVWIPVTEESKYVRNENYKGYSYIYDMTTDIGYLPEGIQPETDEASANEEAEKQAVLSAGGFFIGRYEAGMSSTGGGLSVKNCEYTFTSYNNNTTQANAKKISKNFIKTEYAKTALISGIQWDVTLNTVNGKLDGNGVEYIVTETSYPDRHKTFAGSGKNPIDKVYNIFDLEGNLYEYTAEIASEESLDDEPYRGPIYRGGMCGGTPPYPSAARQVTSTGPSSSDITFRLVLYVM